MSLWFWCIFFRKFYLCFQEVTYPPLYKQGVTSVVSNRTTQSSSWGLFAVIGDFCTKQHKRGHAYFLRKGALCWQIPMSSHCDILQICFYKSAIFWKAHALAWRLWQESPRSAVHWREDNFSWLTYLSTCLQTPSVCIYFHICEPAFSSETYCLQFALLFIWFGKYFFELSDTFIFKILFHCPHTKSILILIAD